MTDMNIDTVTDAQLSGVITAQRGHVQAMAFARKGGTAFSTLLSGIWHAKAEERKSPLSVFLFIENTFTDDEKAAIPVVGSKKGETGNKPYDRYSVEVKTTDGKKTVPGSWYTDAVKSAEEYATIEHRIACCDDTTTEGCPADILAMGAIARRDEKVLMQKAKSDMRTGFVRGSKLWLHAEEIAAINPGRIVVKMPFRQEKDDNNQSVLVLGGSTNIRVKDPTDEFEDEIYSVSEFLALDPAKLVGPSNVQTIKTLAATKARVPRTGGKGKKGKGKEDIAVPKTVDQLVNLFNVGATAIDNATDEGQKLEAALLARVASKGDNRKEAIKSIGAMAFAIDNLWTLVKAEYTQIQSDERRATETKIELERKAKAN